MCYGTAKAKIPKTTAAQDLYMSMTVLSATAFAGPRSVPGSPFERYTTTDTLGRDITLYLSQSGSARLPLALLIQGSGCWSAFSKNSLGQISGWHQNTLYSIANNRFRVMIVEKPGVSFLYNPTDPGTAENCTDTFKKEHTLERWAEALQASVLAAKNQFDIDTRKMLVAGHSEGGITSAKFAANNAFVTHVAVLSGSGSNQVFDLVATIRKSNQNRPVNEREAAANQIFKNHRQILNDPDNWQSFMWGHPFRRWTSFLATSTLEQLKKSSAKIYLAHGTEDTSVPIEAFDVNLAEMLRMNRVVVPDRREGARHNLNKPGQNGPEGMREVLSAVGDWFMTN
jgi:predicted esterase